MPTSRLYNINRVNPFVVLLGLIGTLIVLAWMAKGLFKILTLALPFVLIATAIINYRVLVGYVKWVSKSLMNNPLFGLGIIVFTIFFSPLVAGFLLFKAIASKKEDSEKRRSTPGQYISYEEVDEDFLDLSDVKGKEKDLEDKYSDIL